MSARSRNTVYLVYRIAGGDDQVIIWDTTDIQVGRRKTMDVVVAESEVSRDHAIFVREGERFSVKDLGTGIGTFVNGERITSVDLQMGDSVKIGSTEFRLGSTDKPVPPASNIRFASELKGGVVATPAQAEGGRTMLAFDMEDDLLSSKPTEPTLETSKPRTFSLDGTLEEAESDDPLGLSIDTSILMGTLAVRDLDFELDLTPPAIDILADDVQPSAVGVPTARPNAGAEPPAPPTPLSQSTPSPEASAPTETPVTSARTRRTLVLEIDGPESEVDQLLAVIDGKAISVGAVQLRAKKLDFD